MLSPSAWAGQRDCQRYVSCQPFDNYNIKFMNGTPYVVGLLTQSRVARPLFLRHGTYRLEIIRRRL